MHASKPLAPAPLGNLQQQLPVCSTQVLGAAYLVWRALRSLNPGAYYAYSIPFWCETRLPLAGLLSVAAGAC